MIPLSRKIQDIEESQTIALTQKARAMKLNGIDVVSFTAGEPDFPTPRHIKDAAIRAIETDCTHYTANEGSAELLAAVSEKFARDNGLQFTPAQLMVSAGAKQCIFNALRAILNPGDEVLIPAPYWVSYPAMVRMADGIPVIVPMSIAGGFRPDSRELRKALTPKTRVLILNTPGNPTGTVFTREETEALAELVQTTGITVISDEIYEKVVFDGRKHLSIGAIAAIRDQVITVNGVSKAYAMTGWRIGYMGGPEPLIRAAAKVQGQVTNNANSIAQKATVAALRGPEAPITEMTAEFERRRNYVIERIAAVPGIVARKPDGAMFLFFSVESYFGRAWHGTTVRTASDLVEYLMERHHVALVPGDAFGDARCVRLSFACSMHDLERGMDRLVRGFSELR
jgi:aspartate aminotransferase